MPCAQRDLIYDQAWMNMRKTEAIFQRAIRGPSSFLFAGCALLFFLFCISFWEPLSYAGIEKIRFLLHREMNHEVYYYYYFKLRFLFDTIFFLGVYLIGLFLFLRYVPEHLVTYAKKITGLEEYSSGISRILVMILAFGIFFRAENYLTHTYWCDTLAVASAVAQTPFSGLLTQTLPNAQSAPSLFLLLLKFSGEVFSYDELFVVFPVCLASILSLFYFYRLLKKLFPVGIVLLLLFLFSFNTSLIYYAGELKPYSFDVFFSIVLLFYVLQLKDTFSVNCWLKTVLTGVLAILFSNAMFFAIPAFGGILFFYYLCHKERRRKIVPVILLNMIWGILLLLCLALALKTVPRGMFSFHAPFFAPIPYNGENIRWYVHLFRNVFCFPYALSVRYFPFYLFPLALACIGGWRAWQDDRWKCLFITIPLLLTYMASLLRHYPIDSGENIIYARLILFTIPFVYLLVASGMNWILLKQRLIFHVLFLYFICVNLFILLSTFHITWAIDPLYRILEKGRKEGDFIYANAGGKAAVYIFSEKQIPLHDICDLPYEESDLSVCRKTPVFQAPGKYWVLLCHAADADRFLDALRENKPLFWKSAGGTLIYFERE